MSTPQTVSLREKLLKSGKLSLYLDYYPPVFIAESGKTTRREFLSIYIYRDPANPTQREYNRLCLAKAENIRSERELQLINRRFNFADKENEKKDFLAYFESLIRDREDAGISTAGWTGAYKYLKLYTHGKCKFGQVNERFCEGFKEFLVRTRSIKSEAVRLAPNSRSSYFNKFKAALNEAYYDKYFVENPAKRVKGFPMTDTFREYLTLEELKALNNTDCDPPVLKRAAIFSALTGLRWSDIIKLRWQEIYKSEADGYYIRFIQQKTKGSQTLHISDQAFQLLGKEKKSKKRIFKGLKYSAYMNLKLARWVLSAGITKKITFHCFRHTYATLQLSLGTDIYTVSKLLGHRNVKTTEIYTKVMDRQKIEAANRIKL